MKDIKEPKFKKIVDATDSLSLGISIVVAILIGVGMGIYFKNRFESTIFLFMGIFIGVSAAFLNVYKAYKKHKKELDELKNDPKYSFKKDDK